MNVTTHPPVCAPCVPLTLRLCPRMQGAVAFRVGHVIVDDVYGQLYTPAGPVAGERRVLFDDGPA
ncbi:hypothetical protein [Streptomyces sp. NPDC096152]|uniref:hypothetical protein n=1 Tax=Streptomyces sp. NPDC096152 TaxID=3366078 RepID=UPI0037F58DA0